MHIHTKKRNRLEHKRLNALVYVKYNTRPRERSIKRMKNLDPILVDEIDSDDEWVAEKEDLVLTADSAWLDDKELFDVDAIRTILVVQPTTSEGNDQSQASPSIVNIEPSSPPRKSKLMKLQVKIGRAHV